MPIRSAPRVITTGVAHEGIEQAKDYMAEAMKTGNLKDMIANLTGNTNHSPSHECRAWVTLRTHSALSTQDSALNYG